MLCQNCGKNEVNFKYTQIINGVKKEMALCDKCAKSLGLETLDFNMPINFSNFLGDFFGETIEDSFLPTFTKKQKLQCEHCKTSYDEFIENGKFGCSNCYDVFADGLNKVLKNIHGIDTHVGRRSRLSLQEKEKVKEDIQKAKDKSKGKANLENQEEQDKIVEQLKEEKEKTQEENKEVKLKKLNADLKQAIKEERYEDAAKIRDEIKKWC